MDFKDEYTMTFYSCSFYITNAIHALLTNNLLYSFFFVLLFITSVVYRMYTSIYTNLLDKFAISLIFLYGGKVFLDSLMKDGLFKNILVNSVIVSTFLLTAFLYCYGYLRNKYCFGEDGELCHAFLHGISSIGHHFVLFL